MSCCVHVRQKEFMTELGVECAPPPPPAPPPETRFFHWHTQQERLRKRTEAAAYPLLHLQQRGPVGRLLLFLLKKGRECVTEPSQAGRRGSSAVDVEATAGSSARHALWGHGCPRRGLGVWRAAWHQELPRAPHSAGT